MAASVAASPFEDLSQSQGSGLAGDRKLLILNREMLERSIRHAWKAKRASDTDSLRRASTHTRSATWPPRTIIRCASVNLDVNRGSGGHVSQSYHNPSSHLARSTNVHINVERPATTQAACFGSGHVSAAPSARGISSPRGPAWGPRTSCLRIAPLTPRRRARRQRQTAGRPHRSTFGARGSPHR
jgi:hypothetical protein